MENKDTWVCASAYIFFFIPLIIDRSNKKYIFHANQGLSLLLFSLVTIVAGLIIPVIGWFVILPFGALATGILFIIGLVNVLNMKNKELPFIGRFKWFS